MKLIFKKKISTIYSDQCHILLLLCLQKLQRTVDRLDLQGLSQRRYGQESTRVRRVQILTDQVDASERVVVGAATAQRAHTLVDAPRP